MTDSVDRMAALLDALGHEETVGICLDTGNSWLGGAEPIDYVKRFPSESSTSTGKTSAPSGRRNAAPCSAAAWQPSPWATA